MKQFVFGFDVVGSYSQAGLSPTDPAVRHPLLPDSTLVGALGRFDLRARGPGSPTSRTYGGGGAVPWFNWLAYRAGSA